MKAVRCAIYTRKSSEDGLEQSFNSLDAQREACAAYILSQASGGWIAVAERYDDGGLSGGSLDRPALRRLLADVAAGAIDIIVVYKVDRLTRSLLDFAKLVEEFDKAGTSFVSVTQSFNTTTSMGRLTLNMLLSFAQFEREVTAERIRDKIAASKARGMWMGGTPPIGYRPKGRSLEIVEEEASLIRDLYDRYLRLGNVRLLQQELARHGIRSPARESGKGRSFGGRLFGRGQLYSILKNPLYVGRIEHKGSTHSALHAPIVSTEIWERVQAKLAENRQGHRSRSGACSRSLLAGRVVDEEGQPLVATHATRGNVRYRYYVSAALQRADGAGLRIPARELEGLVIERLVRAFEDPIALAASASLGLEPVHLLQIKERTGACPANGQELATAVVDQVRIGSDTIEIRCPVSAVARELGIRGSESNIGHITLTSSARLTRSGRVMKLVQTNGITVVATPDPSQLKLIAKAHRWWNVLRRGEIDISRFATREGVQASYMTRVLRLAFLSPAMTEAIVNGRATGIASIELMEKDGLSASWPKQEQRLG